MRTDDAARNKAVADELARCIRKAACATDGRTVAGARRAAHGALLALGVAEPLRGRMVGAALAVADAITVVARASAEVPRP